MCLKASGNMLSEIAKFNLPAAKGAEYLFRKMQFVKQWDWRMLLDSSDFKQFFLNLRKDTILQVKDYNLGFFTDFILV